MHMSVSRIFSRTVLFALTTITLAALCQPASSQQLNQTLILFDSSGSMWGKIKGTTSSKFKVASQALIDSLSALPKTLPASGLIEFGGRCTSAPLQVEPGLKSSQQIKDRIAHLNPKGKGPISLALDTAATTLQKDTNASLILIHDGPDNCRRDPCQAARLFAKAHKGVPVHLISIALPKAARIATACVAKLTGGTVTQVEDAAQLDAAIKKTVKLAMHPPVPKIKAPKLAQPGKDDDEALQAKDKTGPPRLRLLAKLGPKGTTLKTPVRWQVYQNRADSKTKKPLLDIAEARLTFPLKPGTYTVVAAIGQMKQSHQIEIANKGATVLGVIFDAGRILLRAPLENNDNLARKRFAGSSTIVTLSRAESSKTSQTSRDGKNATSQPVVAPIVVEPGGKSDVILPAGKYTVVAQKGRARAQYTIAISTGKVTELDLNLGTGQLTLELTTSNDIISNNGVLFKVFIDDPEARSGRREIARTTAINPTFTVPAGTYYVTTRIGLAQTKTRAVVTPGITTTARIELNAALLELQTNLSISGQTSKLPVQYRIIQLGTIEKQIALSARQNPNFILSPGKYRIIAEIGARNVTAKAEIELPPGSNTQLKLNPRAGEVVLKLAGQSNASAINRFWVVRDQLGTVIWRSNAYAPSALLAPGVYEVSCETRNGELKKSFKLSAGESKSVELTSR